MSDVPSGWAILPLDALVQILDSARIPLNSAEREQRIQGKRPSELFPYFGATGQVGWVDDFLFDEPLILLGEDGVPFFDRSRSKAYLVQGKCWVSNHAHVLRANSQLIDRRFLAAYLNHFDYEGLVSGSTRTKLTQAAMRRIAVRLAPRAEQQRIADKLDALLTRVAACRDRLDRVPAILKRFRQAVLLAATSGELTADWRADQGHSLEHWMDTSVEQVSIAVFDGPFGSHLKSSDYSDTGVRVVRLENIASLQFVEEKRTYIPEEKFHQLSRHKLLADDILFSSFVDEEVRVCLLPESLSGRAINKADCFCIRVDRSKCDPLFLAMRLASRSTFAALDDAVHGATRPRINLGQLRSICFHLPPVDEQREVVRRARSLFDLAEAVEARYLAVRQRVDRLTPALLAKAFRGELVRQDPTEEPAAEVLRRVAKHRDAPSPNPRRQRTAA